MHALPSTRRGFILALDTLCGGVIPAEWDADSLVVFYATCVKAESERIDFAELRADALVDARMEPEDDEGGSWVWEALLQPDGTVIFPQLGLTFTGAALLALRS